jgi:hypothetical protein
MGSPERAAESVTLSYAGPFPTPLQRWIILIVLIPPLAPQAICISRLTALYLGIWDRMDTRNKFLVCPRSLVTTWITL